MLLGVARTKRVFLASYIHWTVIKSQSGGCLMPSQCILSPKLRKNAIFREKMKNSGIKKKTLRNLVTKLCTKFDRAITISKYLKVGRMGVG